MKHGGDLGEAIARYGGMPQDWLDLSTGINPNPWPVSEAFAGAVWQRLPSRADDEALIGAARAAYRVSADAGIVAAPGTQALIQWLPYLAAPGAVSVVGPTYSEHAAAWRQGGRNVVEIASIEAAVERATHAVVVNPNNPDGRVIDQDVLAQAARAMQQRGGWLVIDEAFADVDPDASAVALCADLPVIVLRSFGKFYGLAGIRLGFAVAGPSIIARIRTALGPWSCSGPALVLGCAALRDHAWADQTRVALRQAAGALDDVLIAAGFEIAGGTALFRLARHRNAATIHDNLARRHIWCRSFEGRPDMLRFGLPPNGAAVSRLAAALSSQS